MNFLGERVSPDRLVRTEDISNNPWMGDNPPERILVIRLHAIGDVAITLPLCTAIRKMLPDARIDFLTCEASRDLPGALQLFDTVHVLPDIRTRWGRAAAAMRWGTSLAKLRYEMVIDLQRNWVTRIIRRLSIPPFWAEFDRFSSTPAGERALETFISAGFLGIRPDYDLPVKESLVASARGRLLSLGWDGIAPLVCVNPAGLWKTRNWPLEQYADLATMLVNRKQASIVLMGDERIAESGRRLAGSIPGHVINLIGQTSLAEAFATVQLLSAIVSDDSGLMHMAWNSGVPTIALFGSSRHDWSAPLGVHTRTFHSGDLECGACMSPECRYGDVHCLTRYTAESMFQALHDLLSPSETTPVSERDQRSPP